MAGFLYGGLGPGMVAGLPGVGDKPPRYILSFRHRPSVYNTACFAGGEPASWINAFTSRIGVRDMHSYRSHMPARAGTRRYENGGAGWRGFYKVAREQGWLPVCLERKTSLRTTIPIPAPPGFPLLLERRGGGQSDGGSREN